MTYDRLISANELVRRGSPPPFEIIPGWLDETTRRHLITGPSKSGKTFLVNEMVFALGTGFDFLGLIPLQRKRLTGATWPGGHPAWTVEEGLGRPHRSLYIQSENSEYSMEMRSRALLEDRGAVFDETSSHNVTVTIDGDPELTAEHLANVDILFRPGIFINDAQDMETLASFITERRYQHVTLDSVYKMVRGSVNDPTVMLDVVHSLDKLIDETDVTVHAIHHTSTKGESGSSRRESMGSTFFTSAWHDLEWQIRRSTKYQTTTVSIAGRDVEEQDDIHLRMSGDWGGHWEQVEAPSSRSTLENQERIIEVLDANGIEYEKNPLNSQIKVHGVTQAALAEMVGVSAATISRALKGIVPKDAGLMAGDED